MILSRRFLLASLALALPAAAVIAAPAKATTASAHKHHKSRHGGATQASHKHHKSAATPPATQS